MHTVRAFEVIKAPVRSVHIAPHGIKAEVDGAKLAVDSLERLLRFQVHTNPPYRKELLTMRRLLLAAALTLALTVPAKADTGTAVWNATFLVQLGDVISTQSIFAQNGVAHPNGCTSWGFERDPLAPRNALAAVGLAAAVNLIGRTLFRHYSTSGVVFGGIEIGLVANNLRASGAQSGPCR